MADIEKVIKGLEYCTTHYNCRNKASNCPFIDDCKTIEDATGNTLMRDALELLKEQDAIIEQYHKADAFLEAHGWKWESR